MPSFTATLLSTNAPPLLQDFHLLLCLHPQLHPHLLLHCTQTTQPIPTESSVITYSGTCFGCRGKVAPAAKGSLPFAILRCIKSQQYQDKDSNMQEKDNANTYYHPTGRCSTQNSLILCWLISVSKPSSSPPYLHHTLHC